MNNPIFIMQLIGIILAGGFIGEFHRTIHTSEFTPSLFIANFLAGSFLTFIIAYFIYVLTELKNVTLILGGLLSYQDHEFIAGISKNIIGEIVESGKKGDTND